MNIAVVHNLPSGGAKRALFEWVRRLSARHVIDEYTLSTAETAFCDLRSYVRARHVLPFHPRSLAGRPFGRVNQLQRWRDLRALDRVARAQAAAIDAADHDVTFVHSCLITTLPAVLTYLRTPSVYFLHEPFGFSGSGPSRLAAARPRTWRDHVDRVDPLIRLYRGALARMRVASLARTNVLLANSRFTQRRMREIFGCASTVSPYGVDAAVFRPLGPPDPRPHVLSVGELSPRKGFGFLVEALGHVPAARRPPLRLACNMIIEAERERVATLAREHGVELRIDVDLETDALVRAYNAARICVYAPVEEPFGLVALEAMACGRPVVGIREGGVMESVVDGVTGRLVPRDAAAFGAAVDEGLTTPARATEWGRQARDHVERNWTWARSVDEIERHLERVA